MRQREAEGMFVRVCVSEREKYENQGEVKEKGSHGNMSLEVVIVVSGN